MKANFLVYLLAALLPTHVVFSQQVEKIDIPEGIVYNYCDPATYENAKKLIRDNITQDDEYSLLDNIMFIGPVLWSRFQEIPSLKNIAGGNTVLLVDDKKLSAKLTQHTDNLFRY